MALPLALLAPIFKLISGPVMTVIEKHLDAKVNRDTLQAEIEKAMLGASAEIASKQADIIIAESRGESWLQRNSRPIIMQVSFWSCWFVIFPYGFLVKGEWIPLVQFGQVGLEYFFGLTTLCVGGYITGEGLIDKWRGRK